MNKICTDIKQSEKLKKLGISINTADMYWNYDIQQHKDCLSGMDERFDGFCTPAWSLSALLGLIPTDNKKDEYYVDTESHLDYYTVNYRNCWNGCIHSEYSTESLLDAAFEMVCWLKENRRI